MADPKRTPWHDTTEDDKATGEVSADPLGIDVIALVWNKQHARLIAAAPELLEALQASAHIQHTFVSGEPCSCSQCQFIRLRDAAIAKATGSAS